MDIVDLKVTKRTGRGKGYAKKLRRKEMIPAVIYQHGDEATSVELPKRELFNLLHKSGGENLLLNLVVDGDKGRTALVSEMQTHPVTDEILHVDFHGVSMTEKISVKVAIHAKGEAPGVVEGGILDHTHHEVHVECLPTQIPEAIDVDISAMNIGDKIHVNEVTFPEGVVCLDDPETVLLSILVPKVQEEEETPAEAAEGEEASAEPEVIKKGKEGKEEAGEGEGEKEAAPE